MQLCSDACSTRVYANTGKVLMQVALILQCVGYPHQHRQTAESQQTYDAVHSYVYFSILLSIFFALRVQIMEVNTHLEGGFGSPSMHQPNSAEICLSSASSIMCALFSRKPAADNQEKQHKV